MPLFEYRCDTCRTKFALLEGVTAEKVKRVCPHCGGKKLTKLISQVARPPRGEESFDDDLGDAGGGEDLGDDLGGDDFGDDLE